MLIFLLVLAGNLWFSMSFLICLLFLSKVAERTLSFLEKNLEKFEERSEKFSKSLMNDLHEVSGSAFVLFL